MKKSSVLMIAVIMLLSSCGTFNRLASSADSQKFSDGIYSDGPSFRSKAEKVESKAETDALIAKTKESQIYLFGDRKDTVMIPDNHMATIKYDKALSSTVVTISENPYDWRMNLNPWSYYTPYSIGSSWYWSRHWSPFWSMSPMSYGWYDPWYYGWNDPWFYGWSDPWYYGGYWGRWYDPFDYWGYWGWGGPWYYGSYWGSYYSWYPYYVGGWYPNYGFHGGPGIGHGGHISKNRVYVPRYETESDTRVFADNGRTTFRRGSGISSSTSRGTTGSGATTRSSATKSSSSGSAVRRAAVRNSSAGVTEVKQSASASTPSTGRTATFRRPSVTAGSSAVNSDSYTRGTSSSSPSRGTATSGSTVSRSASTYDRSASGSSYNRSSSTTTRSSSYSSGGGGSYSRGSSGGGSSSGGGGSRGGSSSGRR